jgi:hypothetical protein
MKPGNQPVGQVPIPSGVAMPSWKIREWISISSSGEIFFVSQVFGVHHQEERSSHGHEAVSVYL